MATSQSEIGPSGSATPAQRGAMSRLAASVGWRPLLFAVPYAALLFWFHGVDVYQRHFSQTGFIVFVYNAFRVLFIFYLFWMVEAAGLLLLRSVARKQVAEIGVLERLALGFFTGVGVWHLAMFALGYLDLYTVPVAVAVTLPLVVLSYADFRVAARDIRRLLTADDAFSRTAGFGVLGWLLVCSACLALAMLLLIKGLYPAGGHDYFVHYFYYFQTVIQHGGLWPNDVWYQYYYSKGAGLFFLGFLATDMLAPQLVTFCFMAAALLPLFLLLRRIAPGTLWPLAGVVLFVAIYIYTPGSRWVTRLNGGWGDFEKPHEIIATLVIAVIWLTIEALSCVGRRRTPWLTAAASAIVCAVIVDDTIAAFLGGIFAVLAVFYAVRRRPGQTLLCLGLGAITAVALLAILAINVLTTGLASDQGLLFFWNLADVQKLADWGALPYVIMLHRDRMAMARESLPLSEETLRFLVESLRLDLFVPLIVAGLIVASWALIRRSFNRAVATETAVLGAALTAFVGMALLVGRTQPVSFVRYSTFATALTLAAGILLWNLAGAAGDHRLRHFARDGRIAVLVLALCLYMDLYPRQTLNALARAEHFANGAHSIDTAYTKQSGPDPKGTWTAIYPGSRSAYETVGPGTRIWSLHVHLYCMLPDCRVETYPAFIMTPQWSQVMFGAPEEAKQALHAAHLDYFLFTRDDGITDPLPLSPLFAPDNIGRYLGIRWTDGTTALLTWLGPGIEPFDAAWLADYRRAVANSGAVGGFPYDAMKQIFARLHATPHPWRSFRLPWQGG